MIDGDNGWLRPLAILSAEIEYSALRSHRVDPSNVIDACCELHHLLPLPRRGGVRVSICPRTYRTLGDRNPPRTRPFGLPGGGGKRHVAYVVGRTESSGSAGD
jgi:hypothetical protein